jgi:hypothetical protein
MSEMGIVLTEFDKTGDRILGGYLIVKPVNIWGQKYVVGGFVVGYSSILFRLQRMRNLF